MIRTTRKKFVNVSKIFILHNLFVFFLIWFVDEGVVVHECVYVIIGTARVFIEFFLINYVVTVAGRRRQQKTKSSTTEMPNLADHEAVQR